ncbi:MAG: glutamate formimidoyltransferase [Bryobacteraceae bacterium]|nr:glutamate formimidoyltransferase [Bryobacteraceae bacterium]
MSLVECVPNFSEGRDAAVIDAIAAAICALPGVALLDREMDADHHRSVLTFVAPPESVVEAAVAGVAKAAELIDLTKHQGGHPRIGACDVLPFVPLEGVTLEECVRLAERAAAEVWKRLKIPVYLYESAARRPERANLENIRRGQFEGLREAIRTDPNRAPDAGEPELHPTAGALVTGARPFLIAYNINLGTADLAVAQRIAKAVRHSSGGFRYVKAMGVMLESRKLAQVSMNLTNFEKTPMHRVFETVVNEAARDGVSVVGSEIVGLVPKAALEMAADHFLRMENFKPSMVLENRLAEAIAGRAGLPAFLDALAAPSATPGGGSASAAAAAMAAALGVMVARLAKLEFGPFDEDRAYFTEAVDRDAAAYQAVVTAFRRPKDDPERGGAIQAAFQTASEVPLEVFERAAALDRRLKELMEAAAAKFASDVETARALADAAMAGSRANVLINLESLKDEGVRQTLAERLRAAGG